MNHNCFSIRNDLAGSLTLNIEPEGAFFPLASGEEVTVFDAFAIRPVAIKLSNSESGDPIVSIWPGDGEVRVEKGGVDVFDLIQSEVETRASERSVA